MAHGPRPVIGSHYRPSWFRRTSSDGTYEAFNAPMSKGEHDLQTALLNDKRAKRASSASSFLIYLAVSAAAIASLAFIATKG